MGECLIIRAGGGTDTSDATATSSVVLSGFTCYVNDELVTGSMTNRGSVSQSLNPGGSYTIPEGYHDGTGSVGVTTLASNTSANAAASQILTGYNGWVNGANVSGSMANRGNVSQALGVNGSYTIPAGWHAGGGKVTQSLATQGAVNVTPGTANKTACAANRWTTGTIVILGSSALTAGNIKNGVTIFGVKGTFTGWVDSTMTVSAIWPLVDGPNYNEYWSNPNEYTNTYAVRYGYPLSSNAATGISVGQQLWDMGFRNLIMTSSLYAYDRSGACNGSITMSYTAWGKASNGSYYTYSHSNKVLNPEDGAPDANYHSGWSIGDGTKVGATGNFSSTIPLMLTGNSYNYWVSSAWVSVTMTDVSSTSSGRLKLNSFNFYFSK